MRPVVFDLDQTLILGAKLDWELWLANVEAVLGVRLPADEDWESHPVHTDHGLLESLSRRHRGRPVHPEERARFEAICSETLEAAAREHPYAFPVVPGASAVLDALGGRAAIATGNTRRATVTKLRVTGLGRHGLACVCSEDAATRPELVATALATLGWRPGEPATSVGDGVWDVRAARALGVGFVGIAEDDHREARLRAAGARHVIRDYQDLGAVLPLLAEAEGVA